uniref:BTB domain-containing protein n=1 Tax=Romanomermis culicivorax TaxID=13658 RepID=A0A915JW25_ROMCU
MDDADTVPIPDESAASSCNTGGIFTFRSSRHFLENSEKLKKFYAGSQLCDVRLNCAGGFAVGAHRVVLAASSDYFAAMFTGSLNESKQNEIMINGVDSSALKCLINYCYTGEISLTESSVENLLSGACLLQLSEVVDACSEYLLSQLHPSNCLGIRNFADAQGCRKLRSFAETFTTDHFSDVVQQNEYLLLPPDDLYELLSSDDLNVSCESVVFNALITWLLYDIDQRKAHIGRLLSVVRLASLPPSFIADQVENHHLLSNNTECDRLIREAYKHLLLPHTRPHNKKPRKSIVGSLYIIGGMDLNKGALSIERYDYVKDIWSTVGQINARRLQFGVAVLENKIFVVGGREGLKALNSFECWDCDTGVWTSMTPMNAPRHGLAVAVLQDVIYAIGGHDGWSYLSSVERWYNGAKTWATVAEMITPRSGAGVAVLNDKIYVFGGRDGSQCLKSAEYYSPHTNKWTPIAHMSKKRGNVGVGILDGYIFVVGGIESPSCNTTTGSRRYSCVEKYDPRTDQWTTIANLSIGRDGIAVSALGDRLFAIGGFSGQHYLQLAEMFNPESNEWTKAGNLINGRAGACAAVIPAPVGTGGLTVNFSSANSSPNLNNIRSSSMPPPSTTTSGASGNFNANYL